MSDNPISDIDLFFFIFLPLVIGGWYIVKLNIWYNKLPPEDRSSDEDQMPW